MYLVVSATRMELEPIMPLFHDSANFSFLISGVGPVEAAISLTKFLAKAESGPISGVINIGLAGAYPDSDIFPLDICLATKEVFGDIGICMDGRIDDLDSVISPPLEFDLNRDLLTVAANHLRDSGIKHQCGNFITVSSACGTISRSRYLRDKFKAICENMEGAAIARVCQEFLLPCLELRCISNMVVDREDQQWQTRAAVARCCRAAKAVMEGLGVDRSKP
jgi:futalosine hydrolase